MARFFLAIAAAAVMAAADSGAAEPRADARKAAPGAPQRILFIGNSFTYCNSLPGMVSAMAAARKQALQTEMHAVGAATLGLHAANPKVAETIAGSRWDFVVLQDQSARPASLPQDTLREGTRLCDAVKKAGATPVFFLTWAYRREKGNGMDDEMQDRLNSGYCAAAKANGALLAPVGPAWQAVLAKDPRAPLYATDGQHPSPDGTYLAACVFYAALAKQSPVGLPGKLVDTQGGRRVVLADVSSLRAKLYQQAAWDAVQNATIGKLTATHDKQEAAFPTVDDARAKLKKAMPLPDVVKALGAQPEQRNDKDRLYVFRLRDRTMLWIKYGTDDAIASCSAVPDNGGPWIRLDLP